MVQKCSRRWRDKDLDVSYWKPLFLNTFALDQRDATPTTKRGRKATKARSREWRDRYERAWRFRLEPGTCAMGLHLGRPLSTYEHSVVPTRLFHVELGQGVLSVPDVRGRERELRYYVHDEAIDWGPEHDELDMDVWLYHLDDNFDEDDEFEQSPLQIDAGILNGLVIYASDGTLYDPERPAVGRRGVRVGSPLRHLLEAYGLDLSDVEPYGDSRCGSLFGFRSALEMWGARILTFGLADSDEYTLWDQWEVMLDEVPRETLLNWPLQSLQVWSNDFF